MEAMQQDVGDALADREQGGLARLGDHETEGGIKARFSPPIFGSTTGLRASQ